MRQVEFTVTSDKLIVGLNDEIRFKVQGRDTLSNCKLSYTWMGSTAREAIGHAILHLMERTSRGLKIVQINMILHDDDREPDS